MNEIEKNYLRNVLWARKEVVVGNDKDYLHNETLVETAWAIFSSAKKNSYPVLKGEINAAYKMDISFIYKEEKETHS